MACISRYKPVAVIRQHQQVAALDSAQRAHCVFVGGLATLTAVPQAPIQQPTASSFHQSDHWRFKWLGTFFFASAQGRRAPLQLQELGGVSASSLCRGLPFLGPKTSFSSSFPCFISNLCPFPLEFPTVSFISLYFRSSCSPFSFRTLPTNPTLAYPCTLPALTPTTLVPLPPQAPASSKRRTPEISIQIAASQLFPTYRYLSTALQTSQSPSQHKRDNFKPRHPNPRALSIQVAI